MPCLPPAVTRLPLWRGSPDNVIGVLHAKDLLRALHAAGGDAGQDRHRVAGDAALVRAGHHAALRAAQGVPRTARRAFALVVDEYGELEGLVTLEDIIEEIVGDITDEHDIAVPGVRALPDGSVNVDGAVPVRDLNRAMDWNIPDDEATTIAGVVIHEARSIPEPGQSFTFHGFRFQVLRKTRNRITALRVTPLARKVRRRRVSRAAHNARVAATLVRYLLEHARWPYRRKPLSMRRSPRRSMPGVRIGHVHLKVADLDRALKFYCGVLGFELMQRLGARRRSFPPAAIIITSGSTPGRAAAARRRRRARPASIISRSSIRRAPHLADALRRLIEAKIPLEGAVRPRRQRGALFARSRRQRRRALLGSAAGAVAAHARRQARDVHAPARSDGAACRRRRAAEGASGGRRRG